MLWLVVAIPVLAASAPSLRTPTGLSFAQIQITGDEFIVIQNSSVATITDLSRYWLHYFNKTDPISAGAKGSIVQLPYGSLSPGGTVLLSAVGRPTCGASLSDNLPISLIDSGGFLEIMEQSVAANGAVIHIAGDLVSWSSGTTGIIQKVASATGSNSQPVWYRYQKNTAPENYSWQKATLDKQNQCQLVITSVGGSAQPVPSDNLKSGSIGPPAKVLSLAQTESSPSNLGLYKPQVTELLPNPKSPQTDAKDEFIELYNANIKPFDLSGYTLQTGTTTVHKFKFGKGTTIKPKSFAAFYSSVTHLALTNNGGQVKLLDPTGKLISQSDVYGPAADGQAWALSSNKWYWTNTPTPGAQNKVNQLSPKEGSIPTPAGQASAANPMSPVSGNNPSVGLAAKAGPLHPVVLAGIGALAVSYGLYEYRHDLANTFHKFRRYRAARRAAGPSDKAWLGHRIAFRLGRRQDDLRAWLSQRLRLLGRRR